MQREIKFRGQKLDTKEWIYGGYSKHIQGDNRVFITIMSKDHISDIGWHREVVPETLGQYTGLHDKNGKEIYEGDIVSCEKRGAAFYRSVVIYDNEMGRYGVKAMDCMFPMTLDYIEDDIPINGRDYEVIGNIYDNPELLNQPSIGTE